MRTNVVLEGMGMYARLYWAASQVQFGRRLFSESEVDWKKMKQGMDDVLKRYPDQWNINNFAAFACLAEDAAKTEELMSRIEGEPILDAWKDYEFYKRCKGGTGRDEDRNTPQRESGAGL